MPVDCHPLWTPPRPHMVGFARSRLSHMSLAGTCRFSMAPLFVDVPLPFGVAAGTPRFWRLGGGVTEGSECCEVGYGGYSIMSLPVKSLFKRNLLI